MRAQAIEASLEAVAARVGDPAPQVYARLFTLEPALQTLFVRDTDGSVRGQMLQQVFETVLDLVDGDHYGGTLIASEWVNHQNLGVPAPQFALFFTAMIDAFRDILGDDWTPAFEQAWASVTHQVTAIIEQRARQTPA